MGAGKILTAPSVTTGDMFGSSVSLSADGNRAIVGAQLTKCAANSDRCGAAYLFDRVGAVISLDEAGLNMLVAARRDNCNAGQECGKVYHYELIK